MRGRLVAAFLFVLAIVLLAQNLPLLDYLRDVEEDRQRTGLERDAFVIAGRAEELLEQGSAASDTGLQELVDQYRSAQGHRVVIVDGVGSATVISDETAAAGADYSTRPEIGRALTGQVSSGRRTSETLGIELTFVAVPVLSGDDVVGAVRITSPTSEIDGLVDSRVRGILLVVLIALGLGVLVALVVAQSVSRPLRALQKSTNQLATGDLSARADTSTGPLEVRDLAAAFNKMSERLQTLVDAQRSFAGDASHQLRTPLTALRLRVEQARRIIGSDPVRVRDELEHATEEIDRLQHLVDGLLVLARLENTVSKREQVHIGPIVSERIETWQPLVEERAGSISVVDIDPELTAVLLPGSLEQILDNLIDNAIEASVDAPDITVEARLDPRLGHVRIVVQDRGRGMDPDELERAFDRFWRSGSNTSSGSGVGLSIVRRLVEVNDGDIRLEQRAGGGLTVLVTFAATRP